MKRAEVSRHCLVFFMKFVRLLYLSAATVRVTLIDFLSVPPENRAWLIFPFGIVI